MPGPRRPSANRPGQPSRRPGRAPPRRPGRPTDRTGRDRADWPTDRGTWDRSERADDRGGQGRSERLTDRGGRDRSTEPAGRTRQPRPDRGKARGATSSRRPPGRSGRDEHDAQPPRPRDGGRSDRHPGRGDERDRRGDERDRRGDERDRRGERHRPDSKSAELDRRWPTEGADRTTPVAGPARALALLTPPGWQEYELLDSGDERKLERFGPYLLDRPEPNALWARRLAPGRWSAADARFDVGADGTSGTWVYARPIPERWEMDYEPLDLRFEVGCRPFRHTGVFPEQAAHWHWLADRVRVARPEPRVLVLFGYTGLATLALARAGALVTHVDASRPAMSWARANSELSGLAGQQVRWLIDDATAFVQREARRGTRYDGIVLDPPAFGRGPKGEVWRFAASLPALLASCRAILAPDPALLLLNAYAVPASSTMLGNLLDDLAPASGTTSTGELAVVGGGRTLATGIFARWEPRRR